MRQLPMLDGCCLVYSQIFSFHLDSVAVFIQIIFSHPLRAAISSVSRFLLSVWLFNTYDPSE